MEYCKKNLVLTNPEFVKKQRMGLWIGDTPEKVYLYSTVGGDLILPVGVKKTIACMCNEDDVINFEQGAKGLVWYGQNVPLEPYQQDATGKMFSAGYGILQSPAGSGKTQIGIALIERFCERALWLTHTIDLLNQSKERAAQYMDPSLIGTITNGKVNIGKGVTFATIQTMSRIDLNAVRDTWGLVIVDECHRVAGTATRVTQFSKVLNALNAPHKIGLSATVHRADGMIQAAYALLGPIQHVVSADVVERAMRTMRVSVYPRFTGVDYDTCFLDTDGTLIYAGLISYLCRHAERNRMIVQDIVRNARHSCLVLSDRVEHLAELMESLPAFIKADAVMITGKMTTKRGKEERKQALEDMRTGRKRILFATFGLAKEGLDIPCLDRLFITTPQKDYAVVTQTVGRVARTCQGKTDPIVFDYVDSKIEYLQRAYRLRCSHYRKLNAVYLSEQDIEARYKEKEEHNADL